MRRPLLLLILLIVVPIAELYVLYRIGDAIGILPTIALLVADSVIGTLLLRAQGRAVWRRFNEAIAAGRPPAREVLDGALVIAGGAFLITPGFLSDIVGASLLAPPTRALYRRLVLRRLERRMAESLSSAAAGAQWPPGWGPDARTRPRSSDVDGEAVEIDPPELGR